MPLPAQYQRSARSRHGGQNGGIHPPVQTAILAAVFALACSESHAITSREVAGYPPRGFAAKQFSPNFSRSPQIISRLVKATAFLFQHWLLQLVTSQLHTEANVAFDLAADLQP